MSKSQGRPAPLSIGGPTGPAPAPNDPTAQAMATLGGARGMTRTDTGYSTAIVVHVPRNLDAVEKRVIDEAARMGEDFIYSWRQKDKHSKEADGKTTIEGLSIDGAMVLVRNWGNCALPTEIVDETPTHYIIKATFIDLETGFTFPRLYRQRKSGGPGGSMGDDRKEDIAFSIGQSKCQRNAVDKAIPAWLRNKAIDAAKSNAAKKYANVAEHMPKVLEYAAAAGVSQAQLEAFVGSPTIAWTPYDILALRLVFRSIHDKETTWAEEFPPIEKRDETPHDDDGVVTTQGETVQSDPAVTPSGSPADASAAGQPPTPTPPAATTAPAQPQATATAPQPTPMPQAQTQPATPTAPAFVAPTVRKPQGGAA